MAYHDLARIGPKARAQLKKGEVCAACKKAFKAGQYTTLIALGPGADPDARKSAREGRAFNAIALEVHYACATGDEVEEKSKAR